jgi:methyl-accepting chemotaxis protein
MKNLNLATKLVLGFGSVLILLVILGLFSLRQMSNINDMSTEITTNWLPSVRFVEEMNTNTSDYRLAEYKHIISQNAEEMVAVEKELDEIMALFRKNEAAYLKLTSTPEEQAIYDEFKRKYDAYLVIHDQLILLSRTNQDKEALALITGDSRRLFNDANDLLFKLVEINTKGAEAASEQGDAMYASSQAWIIAAIIITILLGIGIAILIIRELMRQLGGEPALVTDLANKIAAGDLSSQIDLKTNDSISVMAAMKHMSDTINSLLVDMDYMSREHDQGDIDVVVDSQKFQGSFRTMAQGVNDMVAAHIAVKKKAIGCFQQFGQGNLDADIEKLPGKRVFINEAVNQIRTNIKAVIADTDILIEAAAEGRLDVRADAGKHQGDFRRLVQGINDIIDGIVLPLNETVEVLTLVEQGDLTRTVNGDYQGQLGDFKDTLNNTIAKLAQTIGEVIAAADQLSNASEQIGATSQSLSQASNEQAASVEETTASIEEMSASINQNSENAKVTDGMATKAAKEAGQGGVAVKQTVKAMKDIANRIGIIDDIAYQTNMLALNAAIEAARAGDHGKGFAVVAAEVRKLAERSQIAAKEIGELAQSSVKTAEDAGQLLDSIVPSISKTSDLVQEIAAASQEQSAGAEQVNAAMMQMNTITQQNASASEELAATAEEMTGQAEQLQALMNFFKIIGGNNSDTKRNKPASHIKSVKPVPPLSHNSKAEFNINHFERF